MSLATLDRDLAVHQKLADEPNDVGGLSAQELKAKFDEAGLAIQEYLNGTHVPQVEKALADNLQEAKAYADGRVAAVGAGDMASAVYDPQKRRRDVFQYAREEAQRAVGSAARFGYVALGRGKGSSRNGTDGQGGFAAVTDPRGFWDAQREVFLIPQGARAFGLTAVVRWARQTFAQCALRLTVNGETAAELAGPNDSSGKDVVETVMLGCPVQGGDRVGIALYTKPSGSSQAAMEVEYLRGEILM